MSKTKEIVYYYHDKSDNTYHCLGNSSNKVVIRDEVHFKTQKLFPMNERYEATDSDLIRFRDDLHKHNNEIKQFFFKRKDKTVFKIDVFNHNSLNQAVLNTVLLNSDQKRINAIPHVNKRELVMQEQCLSCGLMSVDKEKLNKPIDVFSYDCPKFYLHTMRQIRIPSSAPQYFVIDEINFDKLDVGYYRVKIECSNKLFWNVFKFNPKHHYNHNTLKTLHKFKDRYGITFSLLPPSKEYNYNMVWYENTLELKVILKDWFAIVDKLLKVCDSKNWLLKTYISQAWGNLSKYKKIYVPGDDSEEYNFDHLSNISNKRYKYYSLSFENDIYTMISADAPLAHGGLGRLKPFLTEYSQNYMFNIISEHNLESYVVRIQTDSISFTKPVDFSALGLKYVPIPEEKSTGRLIFHNVNTYFHVCTQCNCKYKYEKNKVHICA